MALAAAIFRLQRFGVAGPRLLAMGHRQLGAWQRFSFLLTEPPCGPSLAYSLRTASAESRENLARQFEVLMRQVHDAGFAFPPDTDPTDAWVVTDDGLALASVDSLARTRETAVAR